jgi:hypothetical protein
MRRGFGWGVTGIGALAAVAGTGPACAGAWPREPGETFLSIRTEADVSGNDAGGTSLYGEYGLTRRVTLGAQFSNDSAAVNLPRAGAFLNFALGDLGAASRFAVSVGGSTAAVQNMPMASDEARLDVGVHWGTGFSIGTAGGWATWSYLLHFEDGDANPIRDAYGTIGLRPWTGWLAMISGSFYQDAGGTYRRVTPALGYELREDVWAILQVGQQIGDEAATTLGLSIWWSF